MPAPNSREGPRWEDAPDPIVVELGSAGRNSRSEGAATFSPGTPLSASSAPPCFFSPATPPWSSDPIAPAAMEGLLTAGARQGAPYTTVCLFPGRPSPPAATLVGTPWRSSR